MRFTRSSANAPYSNSCCLPHLAQQNAVRAAEPSSVLTQNLKERLKPGSSLLNRHSSRRCIGLSAFLDLFQFLEEGRRLIATAKMQSDCQGKYLVHGIPVHPYSAIN